MNSKQITIVGVVAISMIIVSTLWWIISPTWLPLYPVEIIDADKTSVTNVLSGAGIDYKYDDASKRILIKNEDMLRAHALLESRGIPQKNGVGLEMFSNSDYGLSEFVQGINYQKAMEEELARSIRLIKGIRDARVHLAIKKQSIFEEKKEDSKASVILTFKENATVDNGMVRGVQQIIASAIPSLSVDSIAILSDDGKILSHSSNEGHESDVNNLEQKYTNSISKLLLSYFDNVAYSVNVDVKFDKKKKITVAENYLPDSRTGRGYLIKSKQSEKTSDATDGSQAGGQNQNLKEEEFVYSKERSEIVYPIGNIEKISAAIVVQEVLTKAEKDILQEFIFNSMGMDATRGDSVSIVAISRAPATFDSSDASSHNGDVVNKNSQHHPEVSEYMGFTLTNIIMLCISFVSLILAFIFYIKALKRPGKSYEAIPSFEREKLIADLKEWMK